MPLIVEDGTGKATADTFISEADFTAYWTDRGNAEVVAASVPDREAALRQAFDYLMFAYRWPGQPATLEQRGPWPRSGVRSGSGWYPYDAIPTQVISAQHVLAVEALKGSILERITPERQVIEETKKLKGLEKSLKFSSAPSVDDLSRLRRFPTVDAILDGIASVTTGGDMASVKMSRAL